MPSTLYGPLNLVQNEVRNGAFHNITPAPSSPVKGQFYFDTATNIAYFWDGSLWQSMKAAGATPTMGTITAETTFGTSKSDGVSTAVARADHQHGNPVHDAAAHAAISLSALAAPTADLQMGSFRLRSVAEPLTPSDAATKNYVDITAQGLDAKASVKAASTANLTLSGAQTVDGIALVAGDRVLCKDQTTASGNGIYVVAAGAWTRATDMDTWGEVPSAYTWVEQGTANGDSGWLCTSDQGGTLGTTAITWVQFSGAGQITAGNGLTKTGNSIDLVAGDTSLTVAADSVIVNTSVIATVASLASYATTASITGVAKKYAAALTGTASPETITHNLGTRDIMLMVLNGASPYTAVDVDWDATTLNTAVVRYSPNLGAGYRVVVMG